MKRVWRTMSWWALVLLSVTTVSLAAPGTVQVMQAQLKLPTYLAPQDKLLLERSAIQAKPLDLSSFASIAKPPLVDYSDYLTYNAARTTAAGA